MSAAAVTALLYKYVFSRNECKRLSTLVARGSQELFRLVSVLCVAIWRRTAGIQSNSSHKFHLDKRWTICYRAALFTLGFKQLDSLQEVSACTHVHVRQARKRHLLFRS